MDLSFDNIFFISIFWVHDVFWKAESDSVWVNPQDPT
jgi:hypothetical protein